MKTTEINIPEVVADAAEVVEAAKRANLFTLRRVAIAAGVTVAVVGTVFVIKKVRAARNVDFDVEA